VLLPSPNNPTGTALPPEAVTALCEAVGDGIVVVDEAYGEFRRAGTPSALELLPRHRNLVVTRTMSKAFAFAGGRLGYLAASPALTDLLRLVRLPYHLSTPTQAIALAALRHAPQMLSTVAVIKQQRDRVVEELRALGLVPVPSDANFVLFGGLADAGATWQALLDRGVLVRDVGIPHYLRVTAGTPEETGAFLAALADIVRTTPDAVTPVAAAAEERPA
jgi:histidinol-phosphate aminotransferase